MVGVDLGITSLAVLSTGQVVPNPRHLDAALTALRRTQRQAARRRGPDRATRTEPSNRWRKTKARVSALHTRVANARRDGLHELSTRLVRKHDTIVVEDLNVAGMVRNHRLARHIAGLGMAELRRQTRLQDPRRRCAPRRRRPVVPLQQDLLGVWCGESQAHPRPAGVRLPELRHPARPGLQRRAQPGCARGPGVRAELRQDGKRARWKPT